MEFKEVEIIFDEKFMRINGVKFRKLFKDKKEVLESIEQWKDGLPLKRIEKMYEISQSYFQKIRQAMGIKSKHGGHQLRGSKLKARFDKHKLIMQEYKNGAKIREVAEKFNITMSAATFARKVFKNNKAIFQDREY